ncbi:MAG: M24 family metallopeptidase [Clostridia bacterium]|nr:M24 family metallopeptidase [Clostridia bacterium]
MENDIITVDLSPCSGNIWGDYARTLIIENGKFCSNENTIQNAEWKEGVVMEKSLHDELLSFANVDTTFDELNIRISELIADKGYVNLDFLGNLGHSITTKKSKRIYIEKGNKVRLSDVGYFTFEPHIAKKGGRFGFKCENIYYFSDGKLKEL